MFVESVIKSDPAAEGLDSCSSDVSSVRNYESSSFGSEFSLKQEGNELKTELDCEDEEKPLGKLVLWNKVSLNCFIVMQIFPSSSSVVPKLWAI